MILLSKSYQGYAAGTIVQLQTSIEAALVAQGFASVSAGPVTPGNVSVAGAVQQGRVAAGIGAASVTVTHPAVTTESKVFAVVAQAAADGTFLRVERILCSAGSFTIYGTAAATAATTIDWVLQLPSGLTTTN